MSRPRILFILTSHDQLGSTGQKTGAYLPEISHPYAVFTAAGFDVDFVSVQGGRVPLYGDDRKDPDNAAMLDDTVVMGRLHASLAPADVKLEAYDAVFYAGGHGTMWDFAEEATLARHAGDLYARGGVVGAVCHGPAGLVNVTLPDGSYLVAGKDVAAFTNDEERAVGLEKVVPYLLEDALVARGARHQAGGRWQKHVVVSERLVTGQNPASARGVAEAMVGLLA
jgi:putative intracellular protease/amidase